MPSRRSGGEAEGGAQQRREARLEGIRRIIERKTVYKRRVQELEIQVRRLNAAMLTAGRDVHDLLRRRERQNDTMRAEISNLNQQLRDRARDRRTAEVRVRDRLVQELQKYLECGGEGGEIDMTRVERIKIAIGVLGDEPFATGQ